MPPVVLSQGLSKVSEFPEAPTNTLEFTGALQSSTRSFISSHSETNPSSPKRPELLRIRRNSLEILGAPRVSMEITEVPKGLKLRQSRRLSWSFSELGRNARSSTELLRTRQFPGPPWSFPEFPAVRSWSKQSKYKNIYLAHISLQRKNNYLFRSKLSQSCASLAIHNFGNFSHERSTSYFDVFVAC